MRYADLVIDNRSDNTDCLYTYGCDDDSVVPGSKVHVPFARGSRLRDAYVVSMADSVSEELTGKIRNISSRDEDVSLTEEMMRTAVWMKKRYLCRYIDAIKCFTPAGSKAVRREQRDPVAEDAGNPDTEKRLTQQQQDALDRIEGSISAGVHDRFLLHGVTGSGKTEVYIRAAAAAVDRGKTAIILVPEISLTGQLTERFTARFGREAVAVLHSKLTNGERYDQWQKIRHGEVQIVIGARSAVFAPLENIGLIVLDEEHEATYKSDFTPKYDTAEVALKRVQDRDNSGVLVLGSATPSVVTYHRGLEGIFRIIKLTERYNKVRLPDVSVVDMREELRSGNRSIISNELYVNMKEQLAAGRQVMLFLNRRGYYTFISCRECGYVVKCPDCGISLTYHRQEGKAVCHYCGHREDIPEVCPECGSRYIRFFGSGTEQVEETVAELFDGYRTDRLDFDTVKKRGELRKKLSDFRKGNTHILIGTQIIAKGLDFRNVGLVGIISADISLNIPDFRSPERTFQLITQAAGRAGRGDEKGRVVIQTYDPEHYAIKFAAAQDYEGFYECEDRLRKYMCDPPYSDLFRILFTGSSEEAVKEGAEEWYDRIRRRMASDERDNVFHPQEAYMNKIKENYRYSMIIRCPSGRRREYSDIITDIREEDTRKKKKGYTAVTDINPYSFT